MSRPGQQGDRGEYVDRQRADWDKMAQHLALLFLSFLPSFFFVDNTHSVFISVCSEPPQNQHPRAEVNECVPGPRICCMPQGWHPTLNL